MKKRCKRLLTGALAIAMSCTMMTAWAANTVTITKVEVKNSADDQSPTTYEGNYTDISVTPEQLMSVTVKLADADVAAPAGSQVTIFSHTKNAETFSNDTIQYIDQTGVNEAGEVTFTFRPRATLGIGNFSAKSGGEGVSDVASFDYAVAEAIKTMTFSAQSPTITEGESASFTLHDGASATLTGITVKDNDSPLEETAYTYENTTLTIPNLTVGPHTITVSADGYQDATASVTVEAAQASEVPEEDQQAAQSALEGALSSADENNLPTTITVNDTPYDVNYTVNSGNATYSAGKLTINEGLFAAKVEVTAAVGTTVSANKVFYIIPGGIDSVAFGNIGLIATVQGADAFATTAGLTEAKENSAGEIAAARALALNIALGREESTVKAILDYDEDGSVTLAEYYIFQQMLAGVKENYTPEKISGYRAAYPAQ